MLEIGLIAKHFCRNANNQEKGLKNPENAKSKIVKLFLTDS